MRRLLPLVALSLLAACGGSRPVSEQHPQTARVGFRESARFGSVASPFVGETFRTTNGKWRGSPTSYTYQWERCNSSGAECAAISAATTSTYTVAKADEGHTLRSSVTATNGFGAMTATSAPTGVVEEKEAVTCNHTYSEGTPWVTINASLKAGETTCLETGTYTKDDLVAAVNPVSNATLRAASGAEVKIAGMKFGANAPGNKNLTVAHVVFTAPVLVLARNTKLTFSHDTTSHMVGAAYALENVVSSTEELIANISVEYASENNLECEASCTGPRGRCLTVSGLAKEIRYEHNTCGPQINDHYIQANDGGNGLTIKHNSFLGPSAATEWEKVHGIEIHQNLLQMADGEKNVTFEDNFAWHTGTNAGTVLVESPGIGETPANYENLTFTNNLFVDETRGESYALCTTKGMTFTHNTEVAKPESPIAAITFDKYNENTNAKCVEHPESYEVTHNLAVGITGQTLFNWKGAASCEASCTFDYNVSGDASAHQTGSTHFVEKWPPTWAGTSYNPETEGPNPPAGYYLPEGLPFGAGYEGTVGP